MKFGWDASDFWSRVDKRGEADCWNWTGGTTSAGYGSLRIQGVHHYAHRLGFELARHPIPEGLTIDHLCRNRRCVNPSHLEPVTRAENIRRAPLAGVAKAHAAQAHCLRGHLLEGTNLLNTAGRRCRICARVNREASRARARAAGRRVT